MKTELDKIKSTITISLGSKNRIRKLKGSMSYEDYFNFLLRKVNGGKIADANYVEVQEIKRKEGVYSIDNFKMIFSYNPYNDSPNFQFDISIDKARKDGSLIPAKECMGLIAKSLNKNSLDTEYRLYFELLSLAIKQEIEPSFKHKGRFEDYFNWKEEFSMLGLPDTAFEEDVMQKLNNYKNGLNYDD
jgi:hypothetical protein